MSDDATAGVTTSRPGEVTAIAAVARNGVIGAAGDIPWRIAEDWARFKRLTLGHVLVMGRKTYQSIGRPLPGRTTVVLTRDPTWQVDGVLSLADVDAAIDYAQQLRPGRAVFIAGGADIYRAAWPRTTRLEITLVDAAPAGDTFFPSIDPAFWSVEEREEHSGYAFLRYRRADPAPFTP